MPNIDTYLNSIMIAELGEDVRGSIHDAIEIMNEAVDEGIIEAAAMAGAPLVASTASDMEDTTKVYVYTGSETGYATGDWYYWDGSAWTSGGVYHGNPATMGVDEDGYLIVYEAQTEGDYSTDSTLTLAGVPADAKAVGDEITELKEIAELKEDISKLYSQKTELEYENIESGYYDGNSGTIRISANSNNVLVIFPVSYGKKYTVFRELINELYYIYELDEYPTNGISARHIYSLRVNGWTGYFYTPTVNTAKYIAINCVFSSSVNTRSEIINALHFCEGLYEFNYYYINRNTPYKIKKKNHNVSALDSAGELDYSFADALFGMKNSFSLPFPIEGQPNQSNPHNINDFNVIQRLLYSDILNSYEAIGGYSSVETIGYAQGFNGNSSMALKLYKYRSNVASAKNSFSLKPKKILITSGVHGEEKGAVYGLMNFVKILMDSVPSSAKIILNTFDVDIIPCVNPWGFNNETRENYNGVNLNRNFSYNWNAYSGDDKGTSALSESESSAVSAIIVENQYDYIVDWHEAKLSNGTYVATQNIDFAKIYFEKIRKIYNSMFLRYSVNPIQATDQGVAEYNTIPSLANEALAQFSTNNGLIFEQAWGGSSNKWSSVFVSTGLECFINLLLEYVSLDR